MKELRDAGDKVLREVAYQFVSNCREEDAVGRWGGEEFMTVINAPDRNSIYEIVERFRSNIAKHPISISDDVSINVTVTIGVGDGRHNPVDNISIEQLVELTDKALYLGKNSGRNQIKTIWS